MKNKNPTGPQPMGFKGASYHAPNLYAPIIPSPPQKHNPHLHALRRQAESFLERARAANNRQSYRRHFAVYLAILAAETKRGQL